RPSAHPPSGEGAPRGAAAPDPGRRGAPVHDPPSPSRPPPSPPSASSATTGAAVDVTGERSAAGWTGRPGGAGDVAGAPDGSVRVEDLAHFAPERLRSERLLDEVDALAQHAVADDGAVGVARGVEHPRLRPRRGE